MTQKSLIASTLPAGTLIRTQTYLLLAVLRINHPTRRVLKKKSKIPTSTITHHSSTTCGPTSNKPVRRWNFRKADWNKFKLVTNKATRNLQPLDNTDLDTSYKAYCSMLTNAVKQSIPSGYQKNCIHAETKNTNTCMNTTQPQDSVRGLKQQLTF